MELLTYINKSIGKSYYKQIVDFTFENRRLLVNFIESTKVKDGVFCDVYKFKNDDTKDLGIITIKARSTSPRQKIIKGKKTIEGYISGKGKFIIERIDGEKEIFKVNNGKSFQIDVGIGEIMQWKSTGNSDLVYFEVCFPPYADGRFEDL
jgi:hypothetical protein